MKRWRDGISFLEITLAIMLMGLVLPATCYYLLNNISAATLRKKFLEEQDLSSDIFAYIQLENYDTLFQQIRNNEILGVEVIEDDNGVCERRFSKVAEDKHYDFFLKIDLADTQTDKAKNALAYTCGHVLPLKCTLFDKNPQVKSHFPSLKSTQGLTCMFLTKNR